MNFPNPTLMREYGTAGVFLEKTAGATPFAARVASYLLASRAGQGASHALDQQKLEAMQLNEQFRLLEQRMMAPVVENLQHTHAPVFVEAGSQLPVGWDEGMVRLASIARSAGEGMAKRAMGAAAPGAPAPVVKPPVAAPKPGPGLVGSLGTALGGPHWKAKALGIGALAGGSYLAMKGVNTGLGMMSRPAPAQSWAGKGAYQPPMGVNQYGYPDAGTTLMG